MKLKLLTAATALVACASAWAGISKGPYSGMSKEQYYAVLSPEEYAFYFEAGICQTAYHHAGMVANNDYIRDEMLRQGLAATSVGQAWRMAEAYYGGSNTVEFLKRDIPLGVEIRDDSVRTILTYNCQKYLAD